MRRTAGIRNSSNWRYRVMKKYKHRAEKFLRQADTKEERDAWQTVVKWFTDILSRRRMTPNGAIGLPKQAFRDILEKDGG